MLDMLKFSRKPYKVGLVLSGGEHVDSHTRAHCSPLKKSASNPT